MLPVHAGHCPDRTCFRRLAQGSFSPAGPAPCRPGTSAPGHALVTGEQGHRPPESQGPRSTYPADAQERVSMAGFKAGAKKDV